MATVHGDRGQAGDERDRGQGSISAQTPTLVAGDRGGGAAVDGPSSAWHAMPSCDVVQHLRSDGERGLEAGEVEPRLATWGPNRVAEAEPTPRWVTLLNQFRSPLI
jgi:hypothetical protein